MKNQLNLAKQKIKQYDANVWRGWLTLGEAKALMAAGAQPVRSTESLSESGPSWFYFSAPNALVEDKKKTYSKKTESAVIARVTQLAEQINKLNATGKEVGKNLTNEYAMQSRLLRIIREDHSDTPMKVVKEKRKERRDGGVPIRNAHESKQVDEGEFQNSIDTSIINFGYYKAPEKGTVESAPAKTSSHKNWTSKASSEIKGANAQLDKDKPAASSVTKDSLKAKLQASLPKKKVSEGRMSELDIERQDHNRMSAKQFYSAYKMTKQQWYDKYKDILNPPKKSVKEDENPQDSITVDVPLLIRLMEFAKENAQTDIDLHQVAEKLIQLSSEQGKTLGMADYESITGGLGDGQDMQPEVQTTESLKSGKIDDDESMQWMSREIAQTLIDEFDGKAWLKGGSYAYLMDVKKPNFMLASDGSPVRIKNFADGIKGWADRWVWEEMASCDPSYYAEYFRPANKINKLSGQGDHEDLNMKGESANKGVNARLEAVDRKLAYRPGPLWEGKIPKGRRYTIENLLRNDADSDEDLKSRLMTLRALIDDPRVDPTTKQYARKKYAQLQASKPSQQGSAMPSSTPTRSFGRA